jgi:serine/threonine-protein kinase
MSSGLACPNCGQPLPLDVPRGPCPACVAEAGLDGDPNLTSGPESGPQLPAAASVLEALGNAAPHVCLPEAEGEPTTPVNSRASAAIPVSEPSTRLQLVGEIARGGMGAILKGRDVDLGRDIAVKVLLETHQGRTELVQRFVEEAQISGQLQHPGVVPIYELGQFPDKRPYFTMKLVKGQTLAKLLADRTRRDEPGGSPSDLPRFLKIFEQVCQTLAYAHARRVIHRDLKPSNIMVGSFGEVQVMDWGLAKVLKEGGIADEAASCRVQPGGTVSIIRTQRSSALPDFGSDTLAGSVLGTPAYMAPEQARGDVDLIDERVDVFGLGAILCEILTGQPPFTGKGAEAQRKARLSKLDDAFVLLDACGADQELIGLTKRCLAAEPWDRPPHAGQVAAEVTAYQQSVTERLRQAELQRAAAQVKVAEEQKRRKLTLALSASVTLTLLVGGGAFVLRERESANRQRIIRLQVEDYLHEAHQAWGKAKGAPLDDVRVWEEALAAVNRAEVVLREEHAEESLRSRVGDLRLELEQGLQRARAKAEAVQQDRQMVEKLEAVRLGKSRVKGRENSVDWASVDLAYSKAFQAYGIDVDHLDNADCVARIQAREIRVALSVALDDWAMVRFTLDRSSKESSWKRLLSIARQADPDEWRNRLRETAERGDRQAMKELAENADVSGLSSTSLSLLGSMLLETGGHSRGSRSLTKGLAALPR